MASEPLHLLILDDEQTIRESIVAFMEDEGYVVFEACSTEQALNIIKENRIDHAVVDIRLPGEDGNHFIVQALKIVPHMKIIIHTGSADYAIPEAVQKLGITDEMVLIKPVADLNRMKDLLNPKG